MNKSEILRLIPLVMNDIGGIGKDQQNTQQKYRFRGIDDALNHVSPILQKHSVSVMPIFRDLHSEHWTETVWDSYSKREKERTVFHVTVYLDLSFIAVDGSAHTVTTIGEGLDYGGDKATNKAMASAFKYAFFFGLAIPVQSGTLDDSDHDSKEETREKASEERKKPKPRYADTLLVATHYGFGAEWPKWAEVTVTFGKYDGTKLGALPMNALDWLQRHWKPPKEATEAELELGAAIETSLLKDEPGGKTTEEAKAAGASF